MALKILKKDEPPKAPSKLPEGGDRFLWDKLPIVKSDQKYAEVLKFNPKEPS